MPYNLHFIILCFGYSYQISKSRSPQNQIRPEKRFADHCSCIVQGPQLGIGSRFLVRASGKGRKACHAPTTSESTDGHGAHKHRMYGFFVLTDEKCSACSMHKKSFSPLAPSHWLPSYSFVSFLSARASRARGVSFLSDRKKWSSEH